MTLDLSSKDKITKHGVCQDSLVTVIVPLYNKEPWLKRCLDSILAQTYNNFELLIINDGSTDQGVSVAQLFTDPRIRIIEKENGGLSTARNRGIEDAAGRFFTFVDADDEIRPRHLEMLVAGFSIDREVVAVGNMLVEKFDSDIQQPVIPFEIQDSTRVDGCNFWQIGNYLHTLAQQSFLFSGSSTMVRRDVVVENSLYFFTEAEPAEDVNYWIRLSRLGKFVYCDYPGAVWHHVDANSIMMRRQPQAMLVPPFLYNTQESWFTTEELLLLKRFLRWEYLKKAFQNRGKKCRSAEFFPQIGFIRLNPLNVLPYTAIRFVPDWLLQRVKKLKKPEQHIAADESAPDTRTDLQTPTSKGTMNSIYKDGEYLEKNPTWHTEDSQWKAEKISGILEKNSISFKRMAEVGCGAGHVLGILAERFSNARFSGYEISPQAFAMAEKTVQAVNIQFHLQDFFTVETERFDVVLAVDVFEHVRNPYIFLEQIREKADYCVFHIPLAANAANILRNGFIAEKKQWGHLHFYSKDTALAVLTDTGHDIIDWQYTDSCFDLPGSRRDILFNFLRRVVGMRSKDYSVRLFGGSSLLVVTR